MKQPDRQRRRPCSHVWDRDKSTGAVNRVAVAKGNPSPSPGPSIPAALPRLGFLRLQPVPSVSWGLPLWGGLLPPSPAPGPPLPHPPWTPPLSGCSEASLLSFQTHIQRRRRRRREGGLQGTGPPRGDRARRIRTAPNRASRAATVHGPACYLTSPLHSPCRCSARGLGSQQPRNLLGALLQGGQLGNGPGQGPPSWAGGWSVPGSCPLSWGGHWGLWVDLDRRPMTQGRPCGRWWAGSRALKDEPWAWGPLGGGTPSCD